MTNETLTTKQVITYRNKLERAWNKSDQAFKRLADIFTDLQLIQITARSRRSVFTDQIRVYSATRKANRLKRKPYTDRMKQLGIL